jgi:hypothetical protein
MRWPLRIALALGALLVVAATGLYGLGDGWFGQGERAGSVNPARVPAELVARRQQAQAAAAHRAGVATPKQILFGDLHAHTTFSFDAFLLNLPLTGGTGSHPPADACDFARHCAALDFWSINDHAEGLSQRLWEQTLEFVRQCNSVAGDPEEPDLVTYLGWEWSQIGRTPDTHYGHKNVVLLGTEEGEVPTRPIAASSPGFASGGDFFPPSVPPLIALLNGERGRDFAYLLDEIGDLRHCPEGVPVRDLPPDCLELAHTPGQLFDKLRDWGFPALVIPHGTTWGIYTPAGATWDKQLADDEPALQSLVEIYSGHGNSEEYRDWRGVEITPDGGLACPPPRPDYLPSCWRAGELIRGRCLETNHDAAECERRAVRARQHYVDARQAGWLTAAGHRADAWLDSGQCRDCFQPAFNYRPGSSVQYMLAVRDFADPNAPGRFELGFIGSSDNHQARPGTGYKEYGRGDNTEGRGSDPERRPPSFIVPEPGEPAAQSRPFDPESSEVRAFRLFEAERSTSFFTTGGLVAVHAAGRDRRSIWDALQRREVYATSGPRILLWFDLVDGARTLPMGSKTRRGAAPRFRVRAVGSFQQQPGCPAEAHRALGDERVAQLCGGECYHPSERRRRIERIELVRIRPQAHPGEPLRDLIEDPWRVLDCPPDPAGCSAELEDEDFAGGRRDAVYYARAVEEPSLAIHGSNPQGCTWDESGSCVAVSPCNLHTPREDDCLSETRQRAWSSPIFVDYAD